MFASVILWNFLDKPFKLYTLLGFMVIILQKCDIPGGSQEVQWAMEKAYCNKRIWTDIGLLK